MLSWVIIIMFYVARCILAWSIWLLFADKKRWRELFPVCIFASFLGFFSDEIIEEYPYWEYLDDFVPPLYLELGDEFEIYPVVVYLFIQWLPKQQSLLNMLTYWFIWTGIAILVEYVHISTGHMEHLNGWSYWHSYIADWILFWLFYKFHEVFQLRKLSN